MVGRAPWPAAGPLAGLFHRLFWARQRTKVRSSAFDPLEIYRQLGAEGLYPDNDVCGGEVARALLPAAPRLP
jgi:hypothetical protein